MDTTTFLSFKINGIPFYTNRQKGNSILDHIYKTCPKEKFIVASLIFYLHKDGQKNVYAKYTQVTKEELGSLLEKDRNITELMHEDRPQNVSFDCEITTDLTDPLNQIKKKILEKFPDALMNISGSRMLEPDNRNWKYSYHIILQNYVAREIDDLYGVKEWCTLPEQRALGFDPNIYRRKGLLKCINQSKGDKARRDKRQKKKPHTQDYIEGSRDVYDHTIHHNIREDAKDIPEYFKEIAMTTTAAPRSKKLAGERNGGKQKKRRLENVPDIPRMNLEPPEGFDIYTADPR
ncbi:hypothetical protein HK104_000853 [Borealophlyctis nickersoniae]|nr:hypothetical protein HK104_000853 [Borealophlyctis nickersoniae]